MRDSFVEVWLHVPTMTTAEVVEDFGTFFWNGKKEECCWRFFRQENIEWQYICDLP